MKKLFLIIAFFTALILSSGCIQPSVCGNGICEANESLGKCPEDCQEPVGTHLECQNQQCVEVNGEGIDKCAVITDCRTPARDMNISV